MAIVSQNLQNNATLDKTVVIHIDPNAKPNPTNTPTPSFTSNSKSSTIDTSPTPVTPELNSLALIIGLHGVSTVTLVIRKGQLDKQVSDVKILKLCRRIKK